MKKVVVDTDIVINYLRQRDKVLVRILALSEKEKLIALVSGVTLAEICAGKEMEDLGKQKRAREVLERFNSVVFPEKAIFEKAGKIMRRGGPPLGDAIIAATAILEKAKLATMNKKDFAKIEGLKLYDEVV